MPDSPPSSFPATDRMGDYVHRGVQSHPWARPIRAAGERIHVHCHVEAIWAGVSRAFGQSGKHEITVRIDSPTWWQPGLETFEDKGDRIIRHLIMGIRKEWDAGGDHP